jgi:hypothetical protein
MYLLFRTFSDRDGKSRRVVGLNSHSRGTHGRLPQRRSGFGWEEKHSQPIALVTDTNLLLNASAVPLRCHDILLVTKL